MSTDTFSNSVTMPAWLLIAAAVTALISAAIVVGLSRRGMAQIKRDLTGSREAAQRQLNEHDQYKASRERVYQRIRHAIGETLPESGLGFSGLAFASYIVSLTSRFRENQVAEFHQVVEWAIAEGRALEESRGSYYRPIAIETRQRLRVNFGSKSGVLPLIAEVEEFIDIYLSEEELTAAS